MKIPTASLRPQRSERQQIASKVDYFSFSRGHPSSTESFVGERQRTSTRGARTASSARRDEIDERKKKKKNAVGRRAREFASILDLGYDKRTQAIQGPPRRLSPSCEVISTTSHPRVPAGNPFRKKFAQGRVAGL